MDTATTKPIKLYVDFISQPARAVVAFCKVNNIPHETIEVRVSKSQQKTSEYSKINPLQRIPTMEEGEFKLSESHTIMRYLCNTRDVPDHWYPKKDLKKRALIDFYLDWHHSNTRRCTWLIIAYNFPGRDYHSIQFTFEKETKFVNRTLERIEEFFLKDKKYIFGDEMSIADIAACSEIIQLKMINFDFSPYPILEKWMERCFENQAMKEVNTVLFKIVERLNKPRL